MCRDEMFVNVLRSEMGIGRIAYLRVNVLCRDESRAEKTREDLLEIEIETF